MRQGIGKGLVVAAVTLAIASIATAETTKESGKVCWTGKTNVISTTKADVAFTWELDWVYTSDDMNPAKSSTGKCIGIRGIVAGIKESPPQFCTHFAADGSTVMSRTLAGLPGDTSEGTYFGGTGALKEMTGTIRGAKPEEMKAPKGMFAGCRRLEVEYSLPG